MWEDNEDMIVEAVRPEVTGQLIVEYYPEVYTLFAYKMASLKGFYT